MTWNDIAVPAGWVTVTTAWNGHLFLTSNALTFTLSASTASSYEVRDYYGTTVASGSVSGTSLTLSALPLGWYKLYLRRVTSDANYGTLIGVCIFSVIAADYRFPNPPAAGTAVNGGAAQNPDHATRGVAMLGPRRTDISDAAAYTTGTSTLAIAQAEEVVIGNYYRNFQPDAVRPRPSFCQFPNGGYSTQAQRDGVTAVVAALYPSVQYFEGPINEPTLGQGTWVTPMQQFYNAVKAGNASAKVLGPCPVTIVSGAWEYDLWLAAGGGAYVDALSFHFYNCTNGDIVLGRKTMDTFMAVLAKNGMQNKELWQTEHAAQAANFGVLDFRLQARWSMIQRFILDQYGVPKERDCWFYDTSHGFWDFSSFWKFEDGSIMPVIPMYRVYSQEVHGKTWTSKLDFGPVENDFYIGSKFTAASGDAVLALMSGGRTDGSVKILLTGATTAVLVGVFGVTSTLTADVRGVVTVPMGMEPVYLRLPAGVTGTVQQVAYGPNLSTWGAIPVVSGTQTDKARITDTVLENWYYQAADSVFEFRSDAVLPTAIEVGLKRLDNRGGVGPATPRTFDTVVVHCPAPHQEQGTLLDYDLEYWTGSAWTVIQTVLEPHGVIAARSPSASGRCTVDSFHSGRSIFVHTFTPVTSSAVRLSVRDTTYGGVPNLEASLAGGQQGAHKVRLREIAVYSRDSQTRRTLALI